MILSNGAATRDQDTFTKYYAYYSMSSRPVAPTSESFVSIIFH